ncbi:MAG: hypothetical protein RI973_777 [Bacteroidota bacterium]
MFKELLKQKPMAYCLFSAVAALLLLPVGNLSSIPGNGGQTESVTSSPTSMASPGLSAAQHIAGVAPATSGIPGHFDVIAEIVVENTGTSELTSLSLVQNLGGASALGSAFVSMTGIPQLMTLGTHGTSSNPTISPTVNIAYNGSGDLLSGDGLLLPGETIVVRFRFEVNPSAPGAPFNPVFQVTATGQADDGLGGTITVSDLSDGGYITANTNPGWPGNTGGSDDPTPLTDCWDLVTSGLTCNNLVQVSFDQNCIAALTPDMILEGEYQQCLGNSLLPLGGYYRVMAVTTASGVPVPDLNPATVNAYEISGVFINQTMVVKIGEIVESNFCWGDILLMDKMKPVITCTSPVLLNCQENINTYPAPALTDNCDPAPVLSLVNTTILDNTLCDDGLYIVRRTYSAVDASGNAADICQQELRLSRPVVDFPSDINWNCTQLGSYPGITSANPLNPAITDTNPATPEIDVSTSVPGSVLQNTGSGVINISLSPVCAYNITYSDEIVSTCGDNYMIVRTWTVLDWCNGMFITTGSGGEDNIQIIKIEDKTPPQVVRPPFQVATTVPASGSQPCRSTALLLPATVTDDCSSYTVNIITPIGQAVYTTVGGITGWYIPAPGLTVGNHILQYIATDACGNQTPLSVQLTVVDNQSPVAVCDELTDVNLNSSGNATVFAVTLDDGSIDNCCVDHFEVRRMTDGCNDGHDDTVFGPSVNFCCEDVGPTPVMVVFRVYDCYNKFNDCMVEVVVNDKTSPSIVSCPSDQRISCDYYNAFEEALDNLEGDPGAQNELLNDAFGEATFFDNCGHIVLQNLSRDMLNDSTNCTEGIITRSWHARDEGDLESPPCTQIIHVDEVSDFVVTFPPDLTVNCGETMPHLGDTTIFFDECENVGVSITSELFVLSSSPFCYKLERTINFANWCVKGEFLDQEVEESSELDFQLAGQPCDFDGDGDCDSLTFRDSWRVSPLSTPDSTIANQSLGPDTDPDTDPWDGFISHVQVVVVSDTVKPVFTACIDNDTMIVGITDSLTCLATVLLPLPDIRECSPYTLTASGDLGISLGPFPDVAPGFYEVTYTATDICGNESSCSNVIQVEDQRPPNAICKATYVLEIDAVSLPPSATLQASELDSASFDNCGGDLIFSFSSDPVDTSRTFSCEDISTNDIPLWVTDERGMQSTCTTTLVVQAAVGACEDDTLVVNLGGIIVDEEATPLGGAMVVLSGQSNGNIMSGTGGQYLFSGIPLGADITLTPFKDNNHLQGVTTYDLVIISRHILNIEPLDSPYKRIAADVNNSENITTMDMVEIRKLILYIYDQFPNNTSWRFVKKDFAFPNPLNPWMTAFPEVISINDIPAEVLNADFVAIKIGDVNNSAMLGNASAEERGAADPFLLNVEDLELLPGQDVTVNFSAPEFNLAAFQFTLEFDQRMLEFVEIVPALAASENFGLSLVGEGALTASWDERQALAADDEVVMTLRFKSRSAGRLRDALALGSRFTPAVAYEHNGAEREVKLVFNGSKADGDFILYQNKPNPFTGETLVGFYLEEAANVVLSIADVNGRLCKKISAHYGAGYHEVLLDSGTLPLPGVYTCQLQTANKSAVIRMVKL